MKNKTETILNLREELLKSAQKLTAAIDRKILIVEDNPAHLQLLKRGIDLQHWEVRDFSLGLDVVTPFEQAPQSIVLLDLSLPDIDGLELLKQLLAINSGAKVIVVTSADNVAKSVLAMKIGACDYIVKSDYADLKDKVSSSIEFHWLTAIEEAEDQLRQSSNIAELVKNERLHAIETIIRTVCHEVNNPLTEVIAVSQLMLSKKFSDEADNFATRLVESSKRIATAVNKLSLITDDVVEFGGQEIYPLDREKK